MRYMLSVILAFACFAVLQPSAQAAPKAGKANKPVKERLVLMPLRVPDEDKSLAGSMETALVQGLRQKYEVFSGEQVAQKAKAIFLKESKNTAKKDCDETRCMQDIAEAFQAELIATANVTKRPDGYFLALSIQNIFDNKVVDSNSVPCKNCDAYEVVEKLKELSGVSIQTISATATSNEVPATSSKATDPETVLWNEVKNTNLIEDYETYISQYPKGKFVALAKSRIKKVQEDAATEAARQEQQTWQAAEQSESEENYQSYIQAYPQGQNVALARIRIRKLQAEQAGRDELAFWQRVKASSDVKTIQSYLDKYPQGSYAAQATERIVELKKVPVQTTSVFSVGDEKILNSLRSGDVVTDNSIAIKAPEVAENGAVVPVEISVARPFNKGEKLFIVVNDSFIGASLSAYDLRTKIYLSTRVKMPASGQLKAVLVDASGGLRIASKHVKVTIGADPNVAVKGESCVETQIRMRATKSGDDVDFKALMACTQSKELYIKSIDVLVDGSKAAEIGLTPGSSKNPYVGLKLYAGSKVELQTNTSDGGRGDGMVEVN